MTVSPEASAAAAAVMEDLLGDTPGPAVLDDAMGNYPSTPAVLGDIAGNYSPSVAEATASEQAAPVAEQPANLDLPTWEADTSGIEDLLDAPDDLDYELEDPQDPEPVLAQNSDEYADPEVQKLRAHTLKLEKQLKYQQDLRAKDSLKGWRAEAGRRFPLSDAATITGTSRRAVLRTAAEQHQRYEAKIKPIQEAVEALKAQAVAEVKAEARAEAQRAWGAPTTGPQTPTVVADGAEQGRPKLDRRQGVEGFLASKIRRGNYGPI